VSHRTGALLVFALVTLPTRVIQAEPWGAAAVITHPTAASRAALERAVSLALNGVHVRLADDALTRADLLIVGRAQARDARGLPLNGRDLERPQHFRLLRRRSQCVLLHVESGKARVLRHTTCRMLPAAHARG
jgi:hypothetical protein